MTLTSLLNQLEENGIRLWAEQGTLKYQAPPGAMNDSLRQQVVAEKTQLLAHLTTGSVCQPDSANAYKPFPLTGLQQAYQVGRSNAQALGQVAAHSYVELERSGICLTALEQSLNQVINAHPMLRAVLTSEGEQTVLEEVPYYHIPCHQLGDKDPAQTEQALLQTRRELESKVPALDEWPLFTIQASQLSGNRTRLHISLDLITLDAWSCQLFFHQWLDLAEGHVMTPPPTLSFRDYHLYQQGPEFARQRQEASDYWQPRLAELPPAPSLPTSSRVGGKPEFRRWHARLDKLQWQLFKVKCKGFGVTPSSALATVFANVLCQWSKQEEVCLNLTLFNRLPLHPEVNQLLGEFTNNTLLGFDHMELSLLEQMRKGGLQLLEQMEYPHVEGVDLLRQLGRHERRFDGALMPIVFTSLLMGEQGPQGQGSVWQWQQVYGLSQTPQVLLDHQVSEQKGELHYNWDCAANILEPRAIDAMFSRYRNLLAQLAEQDAPWQQAYQRDLPETQRAVRSEVSTCGPDLSGDISLDAGFWRQQSNSATALICHQGRYSYRELASASLAIAGQLQACGISQGERVGVMLAKGLTQVASVLACHAVGAAYIPLDPNLPEHRRQVILKQSQADALISDIELQPLDGLSLVYPEPKGQGIETPNSAPGPALAYIIYTSGSTGTPKGVAISHRAAQNTLDDMIQRFGLGPDDNILGLSALSFDLSVYDIFASLQRGACLVLPHPDHLKDPQHWHQLLSEHQVTVWNSVPALLDMLLTWCEGQQADLPASLRLVLLSGDWTPLSLPARLKALAPNCELIVLGGATEAAIWSNFQRVGEVPSHWPSIPYGRPLSGQYYRVLDAQLNDCPDWVSGQLYIGGAGLAQGYWGDKARTEQAFIRHSATGERLYRSGDLARYWDDGTLEFLGREDNQIKLGGYRIELGEIEHTLEAHPQVQRAVAQVLAKPQRLVTWALPAKNSQVTDTQLADFLRQRLPSYMLPSSIILLPHMPLNANGKIDRQALPAPVEPSRQPRVNGKLQSQLLDASIRVTGLNQLTPGDNFFDLGATSLQLVRLHGELTKQGHQLDVIDLFNYSSVHALSQLLSDKEMTSLQQRPKRRRTSQPAKEPACL